MLGHLTLVAEKLLGSKLAVQSLEAELKLLAPPEAEKLFDAVRSKIMSGDAFETQPAGADGLVVLVRAQPSLQGNLINFLEGLPGSRCGPWVVGGWQGVLKDGEVISRFNQLVDRWSKVTNNPMLKAAALATSKTPPGSR